MKFADEQLNDFEYIIYLQASVSRWHGQLVWRRRKLARISLRIYQNLPRLNNTKHPHNKTLVVNSLYGIDDGNAYVSFDCSKIKIFVERSTFHLSVRVYACTVSNICSSRATRLAFFLAKQTTVGWNVLAELLQLLLEDTRHCNKFHVNESPLAAALPSPVTDFFFVLFSMSVFGLAFIVRSSQNAQMFD